MATLPNILIVTCHDTGRHFGCYGIETVHSPAIDALAQEGYRFTNYFAASPVCSASRTTMMTGLYPQQHGVMLLTHSPWDWSMAEPNRHLSHLLRDAGYHTVLFGIQHEALDVSTLGFQSIYERASGGGGFHSATDTAQQVAEFLHSEAANQAPFYAQIGFTETHRPFLRGGVEPDASRGIYVPPFLANNSTAAEEMSQLQGSVRKVDEAMQLILDALNEADLADSTLVVFTVDHGIPFPRAKLSLYDPGLAVALIMRWPDGGIQGGQVCDWFLSNVDFVPTLLDLIGLPHPPGLQGKSFAESFQALDSEPARDVIYGFLQSDVYNPFLEKGNNVSRCIRTEKYKLIRTFCARRQIEVPVDLADPVQQATCPAVQLYDLEADPDEFVDVANEPDYQDIRDQLSQRLWQWLEDVEDPILKGPVPTPYYQKAMTEYYTTRR